jgi:drug/metabolite transporter (DMT)-like permease
LKRASSGLSERPRVLPAVLLGLSSGLLFGLAAPACKVLLDGVHPFLAAGLLYLGAAAGTSIPAWKSRKKTVFGRRAPVLVAGVILFGGILGPALLLTGLSAAKSSSVSVWLQMEMPATALLGILFFREHIGWKAWTGGLCAAAAGITAALGEGAGSFFPAVLVTTACFCWGTDNHLTACIDSIPPSVTTFLKGISAGTVNLVLGLLAGGGISGRGILAALIIGAFSYGLSLVWYVSSAQILGATRAQLLFSTGPFWGVLASIAVLGESFGREWIPAAGFMTAAVLLCSNSGHGHRHLHKKDRHLHRHAHDDLHHDHRHDGDDPGNRRHSHVHAHEAAEHDHVHFPDLHHRHGHQNGRS